MMGKTVQKKGSTLYPFESWVSRQGLQQRQQVEQDIILIYQALGDGATLQMILAGQTAALRLRDLALFAGFRKAAGFYQQDYDAFAWLLSRQV